MTDYLYYVVFHFKRTYSKKQSFPDLVMLALVHQAIKQYTSTGSSQKCATCSELSKFMGTPWLEGDSDLNHVLSFLIEENNLNSKIRKFSLLSLSVNLSDYHL